MIITKEEHSAIKEWLKNNKLMSLCDIEKGMTSMPLENIDMNWHNIVVSRIAAAYKKAKIEQQKVSRPYLPNVMWEQNVQSVRADFVQALEDGNDRLGDFLLNFWRNKCSQNLIKYIRYTDAESETAKDYFNFHIIKDLMTWASYAENTNIAQLQIPYVGNPFGCVFDDKILLTGATIHNHYYAEKINALLADIENPSVVEIGGGIGVLAYFLLRSNACLTYINFDLPEVLAVNQYFLMMAFPERKFKLYGEEADTFDIALLPNFVLPELYDASCDVVVNFHSLSEMNQETVTEYINQITRICKGYFYFENSFVKQAYNETPTTQFPIGLKFRRLYVSPAIWDEPIYREHLCKRVNE